ARPDGHAGRPDHRRHGLRRRHRRAGGRGGATAHRALLQLVPPGHAPLPRSARVRDDQGVPPPRLRQGDGEEHRGQLGRHGLDRPHRLRVARDRRRHDRRLVRGGGRRARERRARERRHAGVEDGQEHDDVRGGGHAADQGEAGPGARGSGPRARGRGSTLMPAYREDHYELNGIDTAVLSAGDGLPLVFLHGGGTVEGFDALLPLAEHGRLIVPHHPGFGASADDPAIDSLHDYVLHYLDLFDALELDELTLIGLSLGGYLAAMLAIEQAQRVRRLVLAAPFGLHDRD